MSPSSNRVFSYPVLRAGVAILALSLVVGAVYVPSARAATVTRGPFLQQPTKDSIVVVWEHDEPAAPELRWGLHDGLENRIPSGASALRHELRIEGLEAGRTYHYGLFDEAGAPLTAPATFPTAVAAETPFRFLVFGDTRSGFDVHTNVVTAMEREAGARFYVNTGDLVGSGDNLDEWDTFFEIEHSLASRIPLFPVIGNHDEANGDAAVFVETFVLPRNAPDPEYYYSFDYGNVHALVLDGYVHSEPWVWCIANRDQWTESCWDEAQNAWLEEDLRAAAVDPDIEHIVVFSHMGPYSSKENRSGSGQMRESLALFREMGVTFVASGHDHYYERGTTENGLAYVITGGGGASLYDIDAPSSDPHEVHYNESVANYLVIDVDGAVMRIASKTPDGRLIDELTIDATPECVTAADCPSPSVTDACATPRALCSLGGRCGQDCSAEPGPDVVDAGTGEEADSIAADEDIPSSMPADAGEVLSPDDPAGGCEAAGRSNGFGPALPSLLFATLLLLLWATRRRRQPVTQ